MDICIHLHQWLNYDNNYDNDNDKTDNDEKKYNLKNHNKENMNRNQISDKMMIIIKEKKR